MKTGSKGVIILAFLAAALLSSQAQAVVYEVNRTFSEGLLTTTLAGTVSVPLGNYVIENGAPNPFSDLNLTLTMDGDSHPLTYALTGLISGSGQFVVDATATSLVFTASGDGSNPADLVFSDSTDLMGPIRYAIGSDSDPAFEAAYAGFDYAVAVVQFPVIFGIAIPEPASALMLVMGMLAAGTCRRRFI
jgi:hypothetical protein